MYSRILLGHLDSVYLQVPSWGSVEVEQLYRVAQKKKPTEREGEGFFFSGLPCIPREVAYHYPTLMSSDTH